MKIPAIQPITVAQSRAARYQLGLSQTDVIKQSELPGYKLKQFESGRFVPDMPFLQKLADFYTGQGVDLSEAVASDPAPAPAAPAAPAPAVKPGADKVRPAPMHRPHFFVSESVTPELLDACLERMHANDERINEILGKDLRFGLMGSYQEQTVTEQQEIFGAMAEGYLIFRLLQGNPLVQPFDEKTSAKTHAQLLGQYYAKSPVALLKQIEQASDELADEVVK
jgi:transcriptional regulator with XRE-family HTH domain